MTATGFIRPLYCHAMEAYGSTNAQCNADDLLNGVTGEFTCVEAAPHRESTRPVRVHNKFHLATTTDALLPCRHQTAYA